MTLADVCYETFPMPPLATGEIGHFTALLVFGPSAFALKLRVVKAVDDETAHRDKEHLSGGLARKHLHLHHGVGHQTDEVSEQWVVEGVPRSVRRLHHITLGRNLARSHEVCNHLQVALHIHEAASLVMLPECLVFVSHCHQSYILLISWRVNAISL